MEQFCSKQVLEGDLGPKGMREFLLGTNILKLDFNVSSSDAAVLT